MMNTFLIHRVLLPEVDYCELDQLLHVDRRGQEARELPEHGGQLAHELVQAGFHAGGDVAEGAEVGRRHSGEDPGVDAVRGGPGAQFNRKNFGLSFGLKNGLRFRFHSATCLNYPFRNIFLV